MLKLIVNKVEITDYSFIYYSDKGKVTVGHKDLPVGLTLCWKGDKDYKELTVEEAVQYHAKNLNIDVEDAGRIILGKRR